MTTYMICTSNGRPLSEGLQEHEPERIAPRRANERGESVWLSETDSDGMGVEFAPEEDDAPIPEEQD